MLQTRPLKPCVRTPTSRPSTCIDESEHTERASPALARKLTADRRPSDLQLKNIEYIQPAGTCYLSLQLCLLIPETFELFACRAMPSAQCRACFIPATGLAKVHALSESMSHPTLHHSNFGIDACRESAGARPHERPANGSTKTTRPLLCHEHALRASTSSAQYNVHRAATCRWLLARIACFQPSAM